MSPTDFHYSFNTLGLSYETCRRVYGWCLQANGVDQNAGVVKLNSIHGKNEANRRACFKACLAYSGSTGCEMVKEGGCYVHTKPVAKGSGATNHYCWAFSNCASKICFVFSTFFPTLKIKSSQTICQ